MRAPSGWNAATPRLDTISAQASAAYEPVIPVAPRPMLATATPAGSSRGDDSRSAQTPNSGWITEEPSVAAVSSAAAEASDRPSRATRNGSSAGTAPWHRSAQPWPAPSRASRRRSIPVTDARRAPAARRPPRAPARAPSGVRRALAVGPAGRVEQQRGRLHRVRAGIQRAVARTVLEQPSQRVGERRPRQDRPVSLLVEDRVALRVAQLVEQREVALRDVAARLQRPPQPGGGVARRGQRDEHRLLMFGLQERGETAEHGVLADALAVERHA